MQLKQTFIPENFNSKQITMSSVFMRQTSECKPTGAAPGMIKVVRETNYYSVEYFDLAAEIPASELTGSQPSVETGDESFASSGQSKTNQSTTCYDFFSMTAPSPASVSDQEKKVHTALFYLSRIISLGEIFENLDKLDAAIKAGNIDEVNLFAHECIEDSVNCGIFATLAPLCRLKRIKHSFQLINAANLSRQSRQEVAAFKLKLYENMNQATLANQSSLNQLQAG